MFLKTYRVYLTGPLCLMFAGQPAKVQTDSLFLSVDQLFERGAQHSLQLQADAFKEAMAQERTRTAHTSSLPDLQVGLKGGFMGQSAVWERGLSGPTYPDTPDWSQNYAIGSSQPLYQGGKIWRAIHKVEMEEQAAELQTLTDQAEIKLGLLNQYMNLFSLFKQHEILMRNIEESELHLWDICRMKKEGVIANNNVLRSEMQLTNDRLFLQGTENSIALVSQQLGILLGQDENLLLKPDTTLLHQTVALEAYDDYIIFAHTDDPIMKLLRKQTELARNEIRLAQSLSLPSIPLYASNTLAYPVSRTLTDMYNNNWNVGPSVSYPLPSIYKNSYKIKESKLMVSLRKNDEEQRMRRIRMDMHTAFLWHQKALQRVEALQLFVRQAQENYHIMQNRYLNQLAILTDLLDVNSVHLNVGSQLVTACTRVIYTYYQLQKVCGRL